MSSIPSALQRTGRFARRTWKRLKGTDQTTFPDYLEVHFDDIHVRFNTTSNLAKEWFYPRYQTGRAHEEPVAYALRERLESSFCFFDIGSNVGFYSALAAQLCPSGSVHSFELDPALVDEICNNLSLNTVPSQNTHVTCAAVWNCDGYVLGFKPHLKDNKSTNRVSMGGASGLHVASVTVDTYCTQYDVQPDVVKVDVEGAELQVLQGMDETLRSVRTLFLEVHPKLIGERAALQEIEDILQRHQFTMSCINEHRRSGMLDVVEMDHIAGLTENCMLLCEPAV